MTLATARDLGAITVALLTILSALIGGAWKFVVVPNLRKEFGQPIAEAHQAVQRIERQVSENGNRDPDNPTLKDYSTTIVAEVAELRSDVAELRAELRAGQTAQDATAATLAEEVHGHLTWADDTVSRLGKRHDRVERRLADLERKDQP